MARLFIVATPIGNLEDITQRAVRVLGEVDFVLSEDTRVGKKLLSHYQIKTPLISFHQHSGQNKYERIIALLKNDKDLALISDAGTPGISDPGADLVNLVRENLAECEIIPIPGVSALSTLLSVAGLVPGHFRFYGFLPHKKGRQSMLKIIQDAKEPVLLYESKHRILKLLTELAAFSTSPKVLVGREMTKLHESFYYGDPQAVIKSLESKATEQKGEFAIVIYK